MNETVYILLPVHNRCQVTQCFIDCLMAQTYQRFHLLLIDDGSTDGTAEMVLERLPAVTVLSGNGSWWWAGSLHQGFTWLRQNPVPLDSIILIINDDTVFEPDFLQCAVSYLACCTRTLVQARYFSLQDGRLIDSGMQINWKESSFEQANSPDRINCLSTRGLFLRYADFMEIGGFHPRLLPHYGSDNEYTIRAHRKGFKLVTDPDLILWGDETTTGSHEIKNATMIATLLQLFSIKSIPNPLRMSAFILLACPARWIPVNLLRIWMNAAVILGKVLARNIGALSKANVV